MVVDGGFGPQTRAAVRAAQRRTGLRATGVADRRLIRRLRARPAGPGTQTGTLKVGAHGARVRGLQVALLRKGFDVGVDGVYGPDTRRAVARMQKRLGLVATGRANPTLLKRIGAGRPNRLLAFPVAGPHSFSDDFGAPRHQGRHRGQRHRRAEGRPRRGRRKRVDRAHDPGRARPRRHLDLAARRDGTGYYYAHLSHSRRAWRRARG